MLILTGIKKISFACSNMSYSTSISQQVAASHRGNGTIADVQHQPVPTSVDDGIALVSDSQVVVSPTAAADLPTNADDPRRVRPQPVNVGDLADADTDTDDNRPIEANVFVRSYPMRMPNTLSPFPTRGAATSSIAQRELPMVEPGPTSARQFALP